MRPPWMRFVDLDRRVQIVFQSPEFGQRDLHWCFPGNGHHHSAVAGSCSTNRLVGSGRDISSRVIMLEGSGADERWVLCDNAI
jgi:hypothetical protein